VEVFYPADPDAVPDDAETYRYTPEEVWGDLLAALPPDAVKTQAVEGAWFDVPAAAGPFPVVVFSHGVGMARFSYTQHAAHLASWGFVVASTQHRTRDLQARLSGTQTSASDADTVLAVVDLLETETERDASVLAGIVDAERVAAEGHSAGGRDAALAAYDDAIDTWIGDAPGVPVTDEAAEGRDLFAEWEYGLDPAAGELDLDAFLAATPPPDKPSMLVLADDDVILTAGDRRAVYDWLPAPKRLVILGNTGHYVFVNECRGTQELGYSKIARVLGFAPDSVERRLLEDGCLKEDAPVDDVWGVWNHLVVAHLESVFGVDPEVAAASLDASYLEETFGDLIAEYLVEE
jgi:dienelactone hydrolase